MTDSHKVWHIPGISIFIIIDGLVYMPMVSGADFIPQDPNVPIGDIFSDNVCTNRALEMDAEFVANTWESYICLGTYLGIPLMQDSELKMSYGYVYSGTNGFLSQVSWDFHCEEYIGGNLDGWTHNGVVYFPNNLEQAMACIDYNYDNEIDPQFQSLDPSDTGEEDLCTDNNLIPDSGMDADPVSYYPVVGNAVESVASEDGTEGNYYQLTKMDSDLDYFTKYNLLSPYTEYCIKMDAYYHNVGSANYFSIRGSSGAPEHWKSDPLNNDQWQEVITCGNTNMGGFYRFRVLGAAESFLRIDNLQIVERTLAAESCGFVDYCVGNPGECDLPLDTDGDSIPDYVDVCYEKIGTIENRGCFITDFNRDSIVNAEDFLGEYKTTYDGMVSNKLNEGLQTLNTFLWEVYNEYE